MQELEVAGVPEDEVRRLHGNTEDGGAAPLGKSGEFSHPHHDHHLDPDVIVSLESHVAKHQYNL